jgi:hypothetical protein
MNKSSTAIPAKVCVLLFTALLVQRMTASDPTGDWKRETADAGGGGKFSSLKIDTAGNAHVAYVDDARHLLRYAFWDHQLGKWFTTTLGASSGFCSLTLDSKEQPHISYIDYGTNRVKYTYWDGVKWRTQAIDIKAKDISYYTSITLDEADRPTITYYEYWGQGEDYRLNLRAVSWTDGYWQVRTIDSTPGSGKFNFAVRDSLGQLHVAYGNVKSENASLRYARWDGQEWHTTILEGFGVSGYSAWSEAIAIDDANTPHIAYTDEQTNLVKYAVLQNGKWRIEVVGAISRVGYPDRNGIAIDGSGNVYISYYDAGQGTLRLAWRTEGRWTSEIIDQGFAGFTSSLQIHKGVLYVTYLDDSGSSLQFAHRPVPVSNNRAAGGSRKPE